MSGDYEYGIDKPAAKVNQSAKPTHCKTCDGDRFVTVHLRSPEQTVWQAEHGITPRKDQFHEEVAPCPDCNSSLDVSYFRHDGSKFRGLDPATVRETLAR